MNDETPDSDGNGRSTGDDERSTSDDEHSADNDDRSAADDEFEAELVAARELLDSDDIDAIHVGVVRGDEVDTTFAQRADNPQQEGLQALSLLAAHVRLVANEAGVEPSTVAGDAATLAGQVEELPTDLDDVDS